MAIDEGNELAIRKARMLRYQRPMAAYINWFQIQQDMSEIEEECADIKWMTEDDEWLINLMDGDEEESHEFKMAFSDLSTDCYRLREDLENVKRYEFLYSKHGDEDDEDNPMFDCFFPAIRSGTPYLGYDAYEGDYFPLEHSQNELAEKTARDRLKRMTKDQILDLAGMNFKIAREYMGLMYRYNSMKAAYDILKGKNDALVKTAESVEKAYEKWQSESENERWRVTTPSERAFDKILLEIPERVWIEW